MSRPIERILTEGSLGYENYQPPVPSITTEESGDGAPGRWGASADTMQYLVGSALEFGSASAGFENLSAYFATVRTKNKAELEEYQRVTFKDSRVFDDDDDSSNDFSKYLLDLIVIDGASMVASGLAALGATALTGGGAAGAMAAMVGAGGASFLLNSGETFAESVEAVGKKNVDKGLVLGASLIMAALDAAVPLKVAGGLSKTLRGRLNAASARQLGKDSILRRAMKQAVKGSFSEGSTEALQEVIKVASVNMQKGKDPFDFSEEQIEGFKEAGIGGAILGGGVMAGTSQVGARLAREIKPRKEAAVDEIKSELKLKIAELNSERAELFKQSGSKKNIRSTPEYKAIIDKISALEKEANKKEARVWSAQSLDEINKIVPITEEDDDGSGGDGTGGVAGIIGAGLEDQTLQQIKDADRLRQAERATQPETDPLKPVAPPNLPFKYDGGEISTTITPEEAEAIAEAERIASLTPAGTEGTPVRTPQQQVTTSPTGESVTAPPGVVQIGPSATQEQLDAIPPFESPYPGEVPGLPVAPKEGAASQPSPHTPSFEIDPRMGLPVVPKDSSRSRAPFSTVREQRRIAREREAERATQPIITPVVEGEVSLTFGEILITAPDIEAAKYAKQRKDIEDAADKAYNEAYEEVVYETGGDYEQAYIAGEEARTRVLRESGTTRTRVYSSPAARLQAQKEAAEARQSREAKANLAAQSRIDERKKFEKEQAVNLKEQAINMANDLIDAFMLGQISGEEFITRRQAETASIQDGIGGTAAVNAYKNIATIARINAILKERGLPTLKVKGEQTAQKDVVPDETIPTEEVPPKGGVGSSGAPTQAEPTAPVTEGSEYGADPSVLADEAPQGEAFQDPSVLADAAPAAAEDTPTTLPSPQVVGSTIVDDAAAIQAELDAIKKEVIEGFESGLPESEYRKREPEARDLEERLRKQKRRDGVFGENSQQEQLADDIQKIREEMDNALETGSPELSELNEGKNLEHEKLLLEELDIRISARENQINKRDPSGRDLEMFRTTKDKDNPLPAWIRKRERTKKNIEALEAGVTPPVPDTAQPAQKAEPTPKAAASIIETAHSVETLNDLEGIAKEGLAIGSSTESADKIVYADGTFRIIFDGPVSGVERTRAFAPEYLTTKTTEVIDPKKIKRIEVDVDNLPGPVTPIGDKEYEARMEADITEYLKDKEPNFNFEETTPTEWGDLFTKYPGLDRIFAKNDEALLAGEEAKKSGKKIVEEINSSNYKSRLKDIFGEDVEIVERVMEDTLSEVAYNNPTEFLYHVTPTAFVAKIKKEGIKSSRDRGGLEYAPGVTDSIHVTDNIQDARSFAKFLNSGIGKSGARWKADEVGAVSIIKVTNDGSQLYLDPNREKIREDKKWLIRRESISPNDIVSVEPYNASTTTAKSAAILRGATSDDKREQARTVPATTVAAGTVTGAASADTTAEQGAASAENANTEGSTTESTATEGSAVTQTPDLSTTTVEKVDDVVDAVADVVPTETAPKKAPVLEYAESTINPQGVPIRIYKDPENPGINIVESEGVVLYRRKDRAMAVTLSNNATAETVERHTPKVKAAPKARPEGKTYSGPKPKGASDALVKWLSGTAPFRLTIAAQRATQAKNVGLDPTQYTTEEELYDAIIEKIEATPVEPVAPVATEVQEIAEEIVEESNIDRLGRQMMERKVIEGMYPEIDEVGDTITVTDEEKVEAILAPDSTIEPYDDTMGWGDPEAEARAQEKQEKIENKARAAERSLEKQTPAYLTSLPLATALSNISNPRKTGGYDINALRAIAENILKSDPSFTYNKKGKRKELEASIHEWLIDQENITEVEDNSLYEDTFDEDTGIISTGPKPAAESRSPTILEGLKGERGFNAAEVEASINEELVKIFGSRTVKEMKKIFFINFLSNKEAIKARGVDNLDTIAFVDQNNGSVYFIPSRISNNTVATSDSIRGLIWHEIGAHVGRDLLSSNEFASVIGQVRKMYSEGDTYAVDAVAQVAKNYKGLLKDKTGESESYTSVDGTTKFLETSFNKKGKSFTAPVTPANPIFWEEVLAHMLQYRGEELNLQRPSLIKRVKDAFKKFFLRIGEVFGIEDAPTMSIDDIFNLMAGVTIERLPSFVDSRLVSLSEKNITADVSQGYLGYIFNRRLKARNDFINDSVEKNVMYHGSDKNWSAPILEFTELGLHVGTMQAALQRVKGDDSKLKKGYIKVTNPFVTKDMGHFAGPLAWSNNLNDMMRDGAISEKDYQKLFPIAKGWSNTLDPLSGEKLIFEGFKEFSVDLREALKSLGYDAVSYVNKSEDSGKVSYTLLSENQFKSVESLSFDSGTNAFKDARAAIASPEKELGPAKKINDIAKPQVKDTRESQGKLFRAAKRIQRAIEPLMTLEGYSALEAQRMLTKGEIGRYHNMGRVLFDVLYQADAKEKKVILDYFETRNASPDALPDRKVDVAMLPTVAKGTRSTASSSEKQSIKDAVVKAKVQIEKLGSDLVAMGLITKDQYSEWQGQYLPRAYLRYLGDDRIARGLGTSKMTYTKVRSAHENFLKDIVDGRIKDPGFLAGRYISMAGADLATINYLNFIAADTGKNGWVLPNQLVKYNGMQGTVGYWNELVGDMRKRISQTELLDPSKVEDMKRVANEIQSAIDKVGEIGSPEGYKRVPDSARYGAMKGLYVKKEIINDIMGMESLYSNNEILNSVLSFSTKTSKWFKYTKVPMNIPTQARNIISNIVLMDVSGTNLFKIPGLLSRAMSDIVADGKYAQLARKYGIEMTTFSSEELVTMDRELNKLKAEDKSWSGLWARSKIFFHDYLDVGGRAYAKTEVMFKIAKMIDLMENHGKSEAEAARLGNEALLDYGNVSQSIRVIRSLPFGSPFITFNLKAGAQMIRNIRNHPIAVAKYAAIPYLVAQMLLDQNDDIEEEDIPAMKKLVADYMSKNLTTMVMPWKDSEGRLRVFDMGYFLPWGAHLNLGKNLWDGEFGEAMKQPGFFGGPFQAVPGLMNNKDPFTGYEIYNEADPPRQRYEDILGFIASYATPPMLMPRNKSGDVIGNGGQLIKTLMCADWIDGNIDKDGLPKNTCGTAALSWLGVNTQPLTAETAQRKIYFKGKEVKAVINRLRKLIDDPNVKPEQREKLINEYRAHAMNIMRELQELQTAYGKVSDAL